MSDSKGQKWLCALCIHMNDPGTPDAQTPAVTSVDGTAMCADHARATLGKGRMRHD